MNTWCVYMHENRVNGKKYIGITGQQPEKRWQNGKGYSGSPYFQNAIKKYGWDAFSHVIIEKGLTQEKAEQREIELIAFYDTTDVNKGYNSATGGSAPRLNEATRERRRAFALERMRDETTRAKIRDANLGKVLGPETREKLRALAVGRVMTLETRARISNTLRGRPPHNGVSVLCIETGEVFPSMDAAARTKGTHRALVSKCCHKKQGCNTAGGYHWQFVDINTSAGKEEGRHG